MVEYNLQVGPGVDHQDSRIDVPVQSVADSVKVEEHSGFVTLGKNQTYRSFYIHSLGYQQHGDILERLELFAMPTSSPEAP